MTAQLAVDRDSLLWGVTIVHVILTALCCSAMALDLPTIEGAHPALKPLKFSISVGLLLGTLAYVVPAIAIAPATRTALTWFLLVSVVVEMVIIIGQALRGVPSHFNTRTPLDSVLWSAMALAAIGIAAATFAIAIAALARPLALSPQVALAVRVGLLLVVLTAVSGFAMGSRNTHSLGAADLRVPHFFALHGLQVLPLAAVALARLALTERVQWGILGLVIVAWIALAVGTLVQALAGRPLRLSARPASMEVSALDVEHRSRQVRAPHALGDQMNDSLLHLQPSRHAEQ
jgi:hypothetical protein